MQVNQYITKKVKQHTTNCERCGNEFTYSSSERTLKRFCSTDCRYDKQVASCEYCGKRFTRSKSYKNLIRFCSAKCKRENEIKNSVNVCLFCNKEYFASPSWGTKYCSRECADEALKHNIELVCVGCGKTFITSQSYIDKDRKYCSWKCYKAHPKGILTPVYFTGLEKKCLNALVELGFVHNIDFFTDYQVGKYKIDFYFPLTEIAIETDGSYWHSLPRAIERDKRKNTFLQDKNIVVFRWGEDEINKNISKLVINQFIPKFIERIRR
jgi:very-short-patch-repair endonuclease